MPDFSVDRRGVDSSGRAIWTTAYMWSWWGEVCDDLGFTPTITQGAFQTRNGGGADESAGFHDWAGCMDLRVWDRTPAEVDAMVRVLREHGAAAWRRNVQHGGFDDPHVHFVLGTDSPLTRGASLQWVAYQNGRDGLASNGPDYEWRPSPLVLTPPEEDVSPEQEDRIVARIVKALLDESTVDKEKSVTVRQSMNQTRRDAAKAAEK